MIQELAENFLPLSCLILVAAVAVSGVITAIRGKGSGEQ